MQLRVLGPLEVVSDDARHVSLSARRRTILAVLVASHGDVVPTDQLIDALWGDGAPSSALTTLRSHLSQLRRHLDDLEPGASEVVLTSGPGYAVDLTDHDLDAARFEEAARRGRQILADDPSAALQLLDDALARWRGPAFGELADHPAVRSEAVRLERARAAAAADRADAKLALGRHREVLAELAPIVAADPLDERTQGQLILAQYRSGQQAEALATYRHVQDRLRDELGVDPSPELQRLHERILRHDPDLKGSDTATSAHAPNDLTSTSPHREGGQEAGDAPAPPAGPRPLTGSVGQMVGRGDELEAVAALVSRHPLVTLIGPGGVGKSRLAQQLATELAGRFDDGVAVCPLAAVRDGQDVGPALLDALEVEHRSGEPETEALVAALGSRRLLLVLDNCEHVLDAVGELVEPVLGRCAQVAVLATSREPLHLPGERVWQVAPLPLPSRTADAPEVSVAPASALFLARAQAADASFALTDDNARAVSQLCHRLDGLPLAIELAAARVRAMTPEELVARLDRRFGLLAGGPPRGWGRHRSLHAVVDWSYRLLTEPEARVFDRLSVFAGAFPLTAAEEVCAGPPVEAHEVAGLLAALVDRSMVVAARDESGAVRYRLLDTLRGFGAEQLADSAEAATFRDAHAAYHVRLVEQLGPQVRGEGEAAAVTAIEDAIDDLRVAHARLVEVGEVDGALRLPVALHEYLLLRLRSEVGTWAERALQLAGAPEQPAYASALATAGQNAVNRGDVQLGRRHAEEALAHIDEPSMASMRARAVLSTAALYEGRLDEVLRINARLAELADALGDPYYGALALLDPTLTLLYRGDHEAARTQASDLERTAERLGNPTVLAWARYLRGETQLDTDPDDAIERFGSAIEVARRVRSRLPEGAALVSLASLCGRRGQEQRALSLFREAVHHWRRLGDRAHQLTTLRNLVVLLAHLGVDEVAARLHGAVSGASPPSFGDEAARLAAAWGHLEARLGADAAAAAARRGRELTPERMADEALAALDALLDA